MVVDLIGFFYRSFAGILSHLRTHFTHQCFWQLFGKRFKHSSIGCIGKGIASRTHTSFFDGSPANTQQFTAQEGASSFTQPLDSAC